MIATEPSEAGVVRAYLVDISNLKYISIRVVDFATFLKILSICASELPFWALGPRLSVPFVSFARPCDSFFHSPISFLSLIHI